MKILQGIPIASGIAKGTVCLYLGRIDSELPHFLIEEKDLQDEITRFNAALKKSQDEMSEMIRVSQQMKDKKAEDIFSAHLLMLSDSGLKDKIETLIKTRLINAEHAVSDVFAGYIDKYEAEEGHFKELAHDFIDTRDRVLDAFKEKTGGFKCYIGETQPVIVAAKMLTPSIILGLKKGNVLGFITEEGGITSHATILARAFNVPMVFGIEVEKELDCGCEIYLDGSKGKVILNADEKNTEYYEKKYKAQEEKKNACLLKKKVPVRTKLGQRISLKVNISSPEEFHFLAEMPHDGIGLLRTEFLFSKNQPPSEDEQYKMYAKLLNEVPDRNITVRLLDIAGDKLPPFLKVPENINPDLELRGAIAADVFFDLYVTQIKALLRANSKGNLKLLYPMVSDLSDLKTFNDLVSKSKTELRLEKTEFNDIKIPQGIMVETPSAVMLIKELLKEVDFINIGSNDLLQYTLAAARGNMLAEKRYHILHPSVLKLIEIAAREGKKEGKEVCLCGEIAAFEEFYPLLLGAGLTSFSVSASKFDDIKCELVHLARSKDKGLVKKFYETRSKDEADEFFSKFL